MKLDLAEFSISIASVAKTGDEHPLQNRISACIIRIGLLQPLGFNAKVHALENGKKI
jgi:hypothetical protein